MSEREGPAGGERTVGWIGMGAIGLPMAARAVARGWEVWGYDPGEAQREAAAAAGVRLAEDPAEVGRRAERHVICVVRSADQVERTLLGPDGALRAAPGRVGIVMSSVGAGPMRALAGRAREVGTALIDAPILGNPAGAATGALTLVVAGDDAAAGAGGAGLVAEARPLLDALAATVVDLRAAPGAAQVVKDVSQLRQIVGMVATVEAMALAAGHGIDERRVLELLETTEPSWATANWDYARGLWEGGDPSTSLGLFAKDLAAAVADGSAAAVDLPLTAEALRLLEDRMADR